MLVNFKGNSQVSEHANACMISLAVACGTPELMFASITALLCEPKRNVPFNQVFIANENFNILRV